MSDILQFLSHSEVETDSLGTALADVITAGLPIALNGQLGSGKTRFVRAVCAGLGVDTTVVNSPTFVIMQLYTDGRLPVAHLDTYRLGDVHEFLAIGAEDYILSAEWVSLIEWSDRVTEVLPVDRLEITICQTGEHTRQFNFRATGLRSQAVLNTLRDRLPEVHEV